MPFQQSASSYSRIEIRNWLVKGLFCDKLSLNYVECEKNNQTENVAKSENLLSSAARSGKIFFPLFLFLITLILQTVSPF